MSASVKVVFPGWKDALTANGCCMATKLCLRQNTPKVTLVAAFSVGLMYQVARALL